MKTQKKSNIMLSILLILALMLGIVPTAWAESSFQAKVTASAMKVYAQESPHSYLGSLPKGTVVTVKNYSGNVALISYNGKTGVARVSDMKAISSNSTAAETEIRKEVVTTCATRIYKNASTSSRYVSVKAGMKLNLLAVNGNYAKVEKDGVIGYTLKKHLGEPGSEATPAPTQSSNVEIIRTPVMTACATRIYKKASTSSSYIEVGKGTQMTLLAVNGNCAMVERNGTVGYAVKSHLTTEIATVTSTPTPTAAPTPTATPQPTKNSGSGDIFSSSYSNEQIIFMFLVKEMNYSTAAACGVLGNIKYESGYRPTAGGDGGTSYGIVQWHAGRKTNLINWCNNNGYDYTTLKGQLYYLKYELTARYTKVHNYLKSVENSDQGAYDAGYYFCYNFEAPSNRASKSVTRGNYARNTLWPRYAG